MYPMTHQTTSLLDETEILPRAIQRPTEGEFAAWFGESKVLDRFGRPLIVYHGTASEFEVFDTSKIGETFGIDEHGFYFTSSQDTAERYADEAEKVARRAHRKGNARIVEAYVALRNPWIIHVDTSQETGQSPIAHFEGGKGVFNRGSHYVLQYAMESGYDGVIICDKAGIDAEHEAMVIALKPEQVRLASCVKQPEHQAGVAASVTASEAPSSEPATERTTRRRLRV